MHLFIEVLIVLLILVLVFVEAKLGRTLARGPTNARLLFCHKWIVPAVLFVMVIGNLLFVEAVRRHVHLGMVNTAIFVVHLVFACSFVFAFFRTVILGLYRKSGHAKWANATMYTCLGMVTTGLYFASFTM